MTGFIGADVAQLRTLANQLSNGSEQLRQLSQQVSGWVSDIEWSGMDADGLRTDWETHAYAALNNAADTLLIACETLRRNADEQTTASEAGGVPDVQPVAVTTGPMPEVEELEGEGGLDGGDLAILIADIVGIFDPTPISDGVSGVISLFKGDWGGAGLSALSMIPYAGDALGKSAKVLKLLKKFENLADVDPAKFLKTLEKIDWKNPDKLNDALRKLNQLAGDAAKRYENPKWTAAAEKAGLPTDGSVPFVPPKNWEPSNPARVQVRGSYGYVDAYGNVWIKGRGIGGDAFEWDVQVGNGNGTLQNIFGDGKHVNVGTDGQVTHNPKGKK